MAGKTSASLSAAILVLGALAFSCSKAPGTKHLPPRTDILLITVDTLRPDHLGCYGYRRATSPRIDALAREGVVFEQAFTFWPKTRASFVMIHTGRTAAESGYSPAQPRLLPFNPTLAGLLKDAGYETAAIVDNANVAASLGYAKGFASYEEVWEEPGVKTEMDGTKAITRGAVRFLKAPHQGPFFLWLHYVNPHAPYTPPPPNDIAFLDEEARSGPRLRVVAGFHGGIPRPLFVPGQRTLAYYVAQYDGEIRTVDAEIGEVLDALSASRFRDLTAVVFASDHGESLGDHDYYFDHGEDLFDSCLRIPLILRVPGAPRGTRVPDLASTLDLLPTLLSIGEVLPPPGLAGKSVLPSIQRGKTLRGNRLFAQNDRGLSATWDERFKLVEGPAPTSGDPQEAFYDRLSDPRETADASLTYPKERDVARRQLDFFLARQNQERAALLRLVEKAPGPERMTPEACERLRALGYVQECTP
jgi:arylsulfatase A-like enzyme